MVRHQAEEAAKLYISLFPNSKIVKSPATASRARAAGTVMTVDFELDGQAFIALNGGPQFKFTEAVSFSIDCETRTRSTDYWDALAEGGGAEASAAGSRTGSACRGRSSRRPLPSCSRPGPGRAERAMAGDAEDGEDRHRGASRRRPPGAELASRLRAGGRRPGGR